MTQAKIEVFTSPTCPHCPHAKKVAESFAKSRDDVKFAESSTATKQGSRRAQLYNVRSVPTLFVTGPGTEERIGYVGTPSEKQLDKMVNIALGQEDWPEEKPGLFSRLAKKIKLKF